MTSPTTPSPQISSSFRPIRYFDMLPPELLKELMDHLIPAEITELNQGERRRTISTLCLTSKTFHRLARPALADALWLGTPHLTGILREKLEIWKNCRWLRLVMWVCDSAERAVLEELVGGARLDDVALGTLPSIVLLVLTSNLTKLHLYHVQLPLGFRFVSPTLKQLSLCQVSFSEQDKLVHELPSLRHLGYSLRSRVLDNNHRGFIASLVPQLQTICRPVTDDTDWKSVHSQSGRSSILSYCTLLEVSHCSPQQAAKVQYLRITAWRRFGEIGNDQEPSAIKTLQNWNSVISSPGSSLTTLYLPSYVSASNHSLTNPMRAAVDALEATCRQRKIEIIYEELKSNHALQSHISQEFVRRVERGH
ncbi:hypothetical protein JCM5353_002305 [Sporobolomyces roseus]